ncbi:MAG: M2 family metallopeptidase [Myxococcales bacterium]|nr:M2 family metallopeptidase [Myxococcales bacterium]
MRSVTHFNDRIRRPSVLLACSFVATLAMTLGCGEKAKGPDAAQPTKRITPVATDSAAKSASTVSSATSVTAPAGSAAKPSAAPTAAEAMAFLKRTEKQLLDLWIHRERTDWVKSTHISHDTQLLSARAEEAVMAFVAESATEANRYKDLKLPVAAKRKLKLLRTAQTLPSPAKETDRKALAKLAAEMGAEYGKRKVDGKAWSKLPNKHLTLGALSTILQKSDDPEAIAQAWEGWRAAGGKAPGARYVRYVDLANKGAKAMGFSDLGELWRSGYDMEPDAFAKEVDRLWHQVSPLYKDLHCYARSRLHAKYGDAVPESGPIPAHMLGNMWAQDWLYRMDLLRPEPAAAGKKTRTLTDVLVERKTTPTQMMRYGEAFFVSLGLAKLPETFWKRSMLRRPKDREVVCHASAWDIDWQDDLRVKMCVEINEEDFVTVHHELGHNYYQRAYKAQPTLFTNSANDGFHEALGDTIALSVTPAYLQKIGLDPGEKRSELNFLMQRAVEKVAFLPFGLLVDKWRWQVFSGQVKPADYNASWWQLRKQYQGIAPANKRGVQTFDPGSKYHVAASVPYMRYFLAHILQFQLHRALCKVAGHTGPLHRCSIYGSKEAGARLNEMMEMGLSRPWPEALKAATGESKMDASAVLTYFKPLHDWLKIQNKGQKCGW